MPLFQSIRKCKRPIKRRRLSAEPLEARRVLAASLGWDGPGLGGAELSYYVANSPDSLSPSETNAAIETALAAWSSAADVTFTPTNQAGLRDSIDITFTSIDGVGGTLAQAYFPDDVNPARIAGDVQFDISDAWEVGNSLGNRAFDLVYVAVHEIGHSLGLDHTGVLSSVLAPFVSPSQSFSSLSAVDGAAIQGLYASADGATTTAIPVDETPTDETPTDETPTDETPTDETDTDDASDTDDDPFPRRRWRRGGGGNWRRWGGRLDAETPEYNYVNPTDVNGDGNTSALDALTIINQLNRASSSIDGEDVAGLCDTNGDGGLVDETDEEHRHEDGQHHAGIVNVGLLHRDAETLITRFDTDDDAALSEDEVSVRLWAKLTDREVDTDADGLITLAELEAAATTARQEAFDEMDADSDGLLVENEVSERFWDKLSAADADADAAISFDEFDAFLTEQGTELAGGGGRHHHHRASDAVFASIGRGRNFEFSRSRR